MPIQFTKIQFHDHPAAFTVAELLLIHPLRPGIEAAENHLHGVIRMIFQPLRHRFNCNRCGIFQRVAYTPVEIAGKAMLWSSCSLARASELR